MPYLADRGRSVSSLRTEYTDQKHMLLNGTPKTACRHKADWKLLLFWKREKQNQAKDATDNKDKNNRMYACVFAHSFWISTYINSI